MPRPMPAVEAVTMATLPWSRLQGASSGGRRRQREEWSGGVGVLVAAAPGANHGWIFAAPALSSCGT